MNERITELANLAIVERANGFREFDANVFAQLIVRECADYVEYQLQVGAHNAERLKQHFGVES